MEISRRLSLWVCISLITVCGISVAGEKILILKYFEQIRRKHG